MVVSFLPSILVPLVDFLFPAIVMTSLFAYIKKSATVLS